MDTQQAKDETVLQIEYLKSSQLEISGLNFAGNHASYNKLIMLLFSGDLLTGLVPEDEASPVVSDDEAMEEEIIKETLMALVRKQQEDAEQVTEDKPPQRSTLGGRSAPNVRDVSGGITITATEDE